MKKLEDLSIFVAAKARVGFPRFTRDAALTTLYAAKVWLAKLIDDGAECPCCGQLAKIYKRKLNSSMAFVLTLIERDRRGDWIHVPSYINAKVKNPAVAAAVRGDWAKLVHWGLLEELRSKRPDGSYRVGYYKITKNGRLFARNKLRVPQHIWIYDGEVIDRQDTETVSVIEALEDKFDYAELMGN